MDALSFLESLGWPKERSGEAGLAKWSGAGSEDMSTISASIARLPEQISAKVEFANVERTENMLTIHARILDGQAHVAASHAGEPPEPIPAQDAIELFRHMSSGLGKFKFQSAGPLAMPTSKSAM